MTRIRPFYCLAVAMSASAASAGSPAVVVPEVDRARLVLVDRKAIDLARPVSRDAWHLSSAPDDRPGDDDDTLRLRVKLRPNKAMGRVSLFF